MPELKDSQAPLVVVVDDEQPIRRSLTRLLTLSGYRCEGCSDAASGLALIEAQQPAVVILDHHLPDRLGADLAEDIAAHYPSTATILFSGHADAQIYAASRRGDARFRFVAKPWSDEELLLAVRQGVERRMLFDGESLQSRSNESLDRLPLAILSFGTDERITSCNYLAREVLPGADVGFPLEGILPTEMIRWCQGERSQQRFQICVGNRSWSFAVIYQDERTTVIGGEPLMDLATADTIMNRIPTDGA